MVHEISDGQLPVPTENEWQPSPVPQSVASPYDPELSVPVSELDDEVQVQSAPFQPSPYVSLMARV